MSVSNHVVTQDQRLVRLRHYFGRHRLIGDVLPVAALALIYLGPMLHTKPFMLRDLWFMLAFVLPLGWRRRQPLAVLLVMSGVALLQYALDVRFVYDTALLVAVYSVAQHESRQRALLGAATLEIGIFMAVLRWSDTDRVIPSLVFLSGMNVAALIGGAYVRTRQEYLETLEERARQLEEERENQAQLAVAAERARISREMHDVVSHSLSVMVALADGATFVIETEPAQAVDTMKTIASTGRDAMAEMRKLLGVLRTDGGDTVLAPQPGIAQLPGLVDQIRHAGLKVSFETSGQPQEMSPGAELTFYRVVQESLTNTMKHAINATAARVVLAHTAEGVDLEVSDDGELPAEDVTTVGHGIIGMRERAELYGGRVEAGVGKNGGWSVSMHLDRDRLRAAP